MVLSESLIADLSFVEALIGIIIAWILVALWQRVTENFFFGTIGLNPESSFHSFVVAVVMTGIFLAFTYTINGISQDIVVGNTNSMFGQFEEPSPILSSESASRDVMIAREEEDVVPIPMNSRASIVSDIEFNQIFV